MVRFETAVVSRVFLAGSALLILVGAASCGHARGKTGHGSLPAKKLGHAPRLALSRVATGNPPRYDIVTVAPSGKVHRVVTRSLGRDLRPVAFSQSTWSPDGQSIAFAAERGKNAAAASNPTDIYVTSADGSHPRRVTRTGRAFSPVWSPDGKTLAFSNRGPSSTEGVPPLSIWLVGADGTSPHPLIRAATRSTFQATGRCSPLPAQGFPISDRCRSSKGAPSTSSALTDQVFASSSTTQQTPLGRPARARSRSRATATTTASSVTATWRRTRVSCT